MRQGDIEEMERIEIKAVMGDKLSKYDIIFFNQNLLLIKEHFKNQYKYWEKVEPLIPDK